MKLLAVASPVGRLSRRICWLIGMEVSCCVVDAAAAA
jgi:hypothetical protein